VVTAVTVVTDGACTVPGMGSEGWDARVATVDDADEIAHLLHDFNVEYDTPTPGPAVIAARLRELLAGESTFALVAGTPAVGVGLVTLRPNVWYEGPVALLDELYVVPDLRSKGIGTGMIELLVSTCHDRGVDVIEINVDEGDVDTQRFYERHGFSVVDPDTHERAFYFYRELTPG
jgi:GNAT superfamily N-acetyltransferase